MKRILIPFLLLMLLSGCTASFHIENQAHVITMGIDYSEESMTVTIQVPSFGGQGASHDGKQDGSSYLIYAASGRDFPSAINILKASLPQSINLTHLKSVVFSQEFAMSDLFRETVEIFMNMFSLSGNAVVIVSRSSAQELVKSQTPAIGLRLSQIVPSMLEYHVDTGFIPEYTLSMLYAGIKGVHSTGACALSDTAGNQGTSADSYLPGELEREGKNKNEYMGSALFDRERMRLILNGRETQLMHLLMGTGIRQANFTEPCNLRLSIRKKPKVTCNTQSDSPVIRVVLYLDAVPLTTIPDMHSLSESLKNEFQALIQKCMQAKVDPFGFAEHAQKDFSTMEEWLKYDWLEAFSRAQIEIDVNLIVES